MTAMVAGLDMPAKGCGAALGNCLQDAALVGRQEFAILFLECWSIVPDDIGHFEPMLSHGLG
jgi:hypothetical protein